MSFIKVQTCVAGNGQDEVYMTKVDQHLTALHNLKSKHFDTRVNASNSEDGLYVQLPPHGLKGSDASIKEHKSHRGLICLIVYSRDTNLLFSADDDGNLCIHCIQ